MTDKRIYKLGAAEIARCFFGVFMLALMIRNSELATKYIKEGLSVCSGTLIPSLFPFMVSSLMLYDSGFIAYLSRLLFRL